MQVMPGDLTLGLDIGTTAVKVLVLDDGGWWKLSIGAEEIRGENRKESDIKESYKRG